MSSLAGTVDVLAPNIPPALVGAGALERLRMLGAELPAALTNRVYLECRASEDAPQVDVILSVNAMGRDVLLGDDRVQTLGVSLRFAPAWQRVRTLARSWDDSRHPLHGAIRRLWLEFDLAPARAPHAAVEQPGVFVDLAPNAYRDRSGAKPLAACVDALSTLSDAAESRIDALRGCIDALPPAACLMYVGVFPGRDASVIRACVAGVSDDEVEDYLDAAGWTGSRDALRAMLAPFAAHRDARGRAMTVLHLDLGPTVGPRLGLERALGRRSQPRGRIDDAAVLDALVAAGLSDEGKRRALDAWPGVDTRVMPHELWPAVVNRRVNHVKIVGGGNERPHLKFYLCATHQYFDRRAAATRRRDLHPDPTKATRQSIR